MSKTFVKKPSGLFRGEVVASIDEDGRVEILEDGTKRIAYLEGGDVYDPGGILGKKLVLRGDGRGGFYEPSGLGLGELAFQIMPDGSVRNSDGDYIGRIDGTLSEFLEKHSGSPSASSGNGAVAASGKDSGGGEGDGIGIGIGCSPMLLVPLAVVGLVLSCCYVFWGNIRLDEFNHQMFVFVLLMATACIGSSVFVAKSMVGHMPFAGEHAATFAGSYVAAGFAYALFAIVEAAVNGTLGIADVVMALIFSPIYMFGASLPVLLLQLLAFWLVGKAAKSPGD